ncbi:stage VI sporulation protein D [Bacillus sp. 165]|uniref:stage VI sporulation protein D n=1 Tax=Bacillus sp. 165 TaxID=1529117 RepID=UPI0032AEC482
MTADNQTSLRFSLKESVWFQKGQEVEELLSISLDPYIVIHERDYDVVVKGELQLSGEYIPQEAEEAAFSLRELSPVRTVDEVNVREDGVNELSHAFPLEISIPKARVQQVDNLYVTIESFDYEMPEKGCLQLLADIEISGLCQEGREEEVYEEENQEEFYVPVEQERYEEELEEEELFEPFELEIRKAPVAEKEEKAPQDLHVNRKDTFPQVELFSRAQEILEKEAQTEEEEFAYSARDENALYLTKLFSKEREEDFTKLRIYFVQNGDTVESIAERYELNVQQITRVNQLDDFHLEEGKMLYIPVPKSKSKS